MRAASIGGQYRPGGASALRALRALHADGASVGMVAVGRPERLNVDFPPPRSQPLIRELASEVFALALANPSIGLDLPTGDPRASLARAHVLAALRWAETLSFNAVAVASGTARDRGHRNELSDLVSNCQAVLEHYKGPVQLLLRNRPGSSRDSSVGHDIGELVAIATEAGPARRIAVALDTAAAHQHGYAIEEIDEQLSRFKRLRAVLLTLPGRDGGPAELPSRAIWSYEQLEQLIAGHGRLPFLMSSNRAAKQLAARLAG